MREENHRSRQGSEILTIVPFTHGACFLDHCHSSEPAGEPEYPSLLPSLSETRERDKRTEYSSLRQDMLFFSDKLFF